MRCCFGDFPSHSQVRLYIGDGCCHGGLDDFSRLDDLVSGRLDIQLMDNEEREQGLLLLRQILDTGGTVCAHDNVDHRPYMRMQKQRWLTGRHLGNRVIYEVTEAGSQAILK